MNVMLKKKNWWLLILAMCVIAAALIVPQFVAVHFGLFDSAGGSCISVVFDKHSVITADRIVYRVGDQEITITDPETVGYIAKQFVVANRAGLCPSQQNRWMYIYNGDKLVRSMQWRACEEFVDIYEADSTHWLLPGEVRTGQVELSREFLDYLDSLMESK